MKILLSIMLFVACSTPIFAQSAHDVFTSESLTWYGIDFSKVKLIGLSAFSNLQEIRDVQFNAINEVIISEPKKFNLQKFLYKKEVKNNLGIVSKRNLAVKLEGLASDDPKEKTVLTDEMIASTIHEYDFGSDAGLGVVFLMETLEKLENKQGTMIVAFFDIASKKVLLSQRMVGPGGGFGFRNYWVNSIFKVLKEIYDDTYSQWKKTYMK